MRKVPNVLKQLDEIDKLKLEVEYYKGRCEGYESLLTKVINNVTKFQIIDLKENKINGFN